MKLCNCSKTLKRFTNFQHISARPAFGNTSCRHVDAVVSILTFQQESPFFHPSLCFSLHGIFIFFQCILSGYPSFLSKYKKMNFRITALTKLLGLSGTCVHKWLFVFVFVLTGDGLLTCPDGTSPLPKRQLKMKTSTLQSCKNNQVEKVD